MKFKLFLLFIVIAVAGFTSSPIYADSVITVQNASFENLSLSPTIGCGTGCFYNTGPIPGWTLSGSGGSFQPNATYFTLPLPSGNVVAYTNGGTISQDLGVFLLPNSVYTLSVLVGNRLDGLSGPYSIALDAGGTPLSTPFIGSGNATGTFADQILTFSTGSAVLPGQDLSIFLASQGGPQADFDNVSLTVRQNTTVPEPSSLILLFAGIGLVGLFSLLRRV